MIAQAKKKRTTLLVGTLFSSTIFLPILFFIIIILALCSTSQNAGDEYSGIYQNTGLSSECENYRQQVVECAKKFGMEDYVSLLMAVMMQESGGRVLDVMQAAEGQFNTKYPKKPNGITDAAYSIECGVQELKYNLELANVANADDMDHIKLALQGYNYGSGYITWALKRDGKYTKENAIAYSEMMLNRPNWHYSIYGDREYVDHVLQYYVQVFTGTGTNQVTNNALKLQGCDYVWGAQGPTQFDCSGFIYYVFSQSGYQIGGRLTADGYSRLAKRITQQNAIPGDLICFDWDGNGRYDHIGIFLGNNQMIHAHGSQDRQYAKNGYMVECKTLAGSYQTKAEYFTLRDYAPK